MSSLRNAVKRITHKERAQPQNRAHLGLLEKKKDYKKRAIDYHRKEDQIRRLREKAAMRNPDEFYFGMHNSQVVDGQHKKTREALKKQFEEEVGHDTIRIMKDQDLRYVRLQKQKDAKQVEKLKSSLHFIERTDKENPTFRKRKHTIFVDSKTDAENFDAAKHFDTVPQLVDRAFNRPRIETLKKAAMQQLGRYEDSDDEYYSSKPTVEDLEKQAKAAWKQARMVARARNRAYGEMQAREERVKAMERAEAHLVTEKLLAAKGKKRKIKAAENGMPAVYEWASKRLG